MGDARWRARAGACMYVCAGNWGIVVCGRSTYRVYESRQPIASLPFVVGCRREVWRMDLG